LTPFSPQVPLTSEQARLLRLLGHTQSAFTLAPQCVWERKGGKFRRLAEAQDE
jgi:hypothetical protein